MKHSGVPLQNKRIAASGCSVVKSDKQWFLVDCMVVSVMSLKEAYCRLQEPVRIRTLG